jgi:hypothetical protein
MTKSAPYAKVAISLPEADLAAADRLAQELDRSRSWVIAEALRRFVAGVVAGAGEAPAATDLGASRRAQLRRDLALSPEQRVHAAEETLAASSRIGAPRIFSHFDDFLAWQRAEGSSE